MQHCLTPNLITLAKNITSRLTVLKNGQITINIDDKIIPPVSVATHFNCILICKNYENCADYIILFRCLCKE